MSSARPPEVPSVPEAPVRSGPKLTRRTVAGVVALLAVVLGAFTVSSLAMNGRALDAQLEESVEQVWDRSVSYLFRGRGGPGDSDRFYDRDPLEASGQPTGTLGLVTEDDEVVHASRLDEDSDVVDLSEEDMDTLAATAEGTGDYTRVWMAELETGRYLVQAEAVGRDDDVMVLVGLPTDSIDSTKATLARVQILGSLAALLLTWLCGWWWIRRSLRPLAEVSAAAARVSEVPMGSGEVPLSGYRVSRGLTHSGDEVGAVGLALNRLIDSVDAAFDHRNRSERRLRTFVADASHELRTPLAAVRGYAEMIRMTEPLTDRGQDSLSRVLHQADRMGSLVENMLLLARLDADQAGQRGEVDLGEVVVDEVMDATAAGREHVWTVDVPDQPVTLLGDRQQLAQLVSNLLSNARKHTTAGTTVAVQVQEEDAGEGDGRVVVLRVEDDGPGIDPELQNGLFDRFVRGDTARTTTEGSTGLGLSIVRSVAVSHGGEATVVSRPGQTVFTVRLPGT